MHHLDHLPRPEADRRMRHRPLFGGDLRPLYDVERQDWSDGARRRHHRRSRCCRDLAGRPISPAVTASGGARRPGLRRARRSSPARSTPRRRRSASACGTCGDMMLMYGSTIFIIMLTDAPFAMPGSGMRPGSSRASTPRWRGSRPAARSPTGSATQLARDLTGRRLRAAGGRGGSVAARRRRAGRAALFLRRADADPRSARQGRALRAEPHPHARRHLTARCSRASPAARPMSSRPTPRQALPRAGCWRSAAACANEVWAQATSDFCELDQMVCGTSIGASYGDAFLAALAVGDAAPDDIAAWNPEGPGQHRVRRDLGVAAPRRRRRHRPGPSTPVRSRSRTARRWPRRRSNGADQRPRDGRDPARGRRVPAGGRTWRLRRTSSHPDERFSE